MLNSSLHLHQFFLLLMAGAAPVELFCEHIFDCGIVWVVSGWLAFSMNDTDAQGQ